MLDKISGEIEHLKRHLTVMWVVAKQGPIGIMKLTEGLKQPQHRIRYSLRILKQRQYIRATTVGAVATPKAFEMLENFDEGLDKLMARLSRLRLGSKPENKHYLY